ncbi:ribonuclease HII [Thermoleophilum album]|uniref:Ribonuclease HII n=1 Tax=Thermoleophilum album TaxID=29539 RepID=A0A1H6FWE7_THEAL|nr:ribonuclease HII [Thermoleophilum album]SEH15121.1 RNase HII [Thermoleophilum album]
MPQRRASKGERGRSRGRRRSAALSKLLAFDRSLGARFVAGADEAGRGPLAGPLVAAAVLFDLERLEQHFPRELRELDDSKRHEQADRERLFRAVLAAASGIRVVFRGPAEIDRDGLHRSNLSALREALQAVACQGCVCVVDGFEVGTLPHPQVAVVGGDRKSAAVAAASIVAKVLRDRHMQRLAVRYPLWGFEKHVGYSTPEHRAAILTHGLTPLHRRSFASVAYQQLELTPNVPAGASGLEDSLEVSKLAQAEVGVDDHGDSVEAQVFPAG